MGNQNKVFKFYMPKRIIDKFNIKNKVAIVTGGVGLLGEKHAEAIAEMGGIPILLDIDGEKGEATAEKISKIYSISCSYYNCDISNEDVIVNVKDDIIKTHGKIDILINNAAIDPKVKTDNSNETSRLEKFSLEQWNLELSVGLTGAYLCSKIFGSEMAQNGGSVIVNISSDLGLIAPDQRLYAKEGIDKDKQNTKPVTYSVIKTGLIGLTRYLSTYWTEQNVRCNAICPGGVENGQPENFLTKVKFRIPMGRLAKSYEYQGSLIWMLSDASSYLNGAIIPVDGGRTAW